MSQHRPCKLFIPQDLLPLLKRDAYGRRQEPLSDGVFHFAFARNSSTHSGRYLSGVLSSPEAAFRLPDASQNE
jgi:hypothetical protein